MNSARTTRGAVADFSLRKKERGINSAKTWASRVVADFSLRLRKRKLKFAKTMGIRAVTDSQSRTLGGTWDSLRRDYQPAADGLKGQVPRKRGLKSAKTMRSRVLANFSSRKKERRLKVG